MLLALPVPRGLRVSKDLPVLRAPRVSRDLPVLRGPRANKGPPVRLLQLLLVLSPPALPVPRLLLPIPAPILPQSWTSPSHRALLVLPAPRDLKVNKDLLVLRGPRASRGLPVLRGLKVSRGPLARPLQSPLVLSLPVLPVPRLLSPTPAPILPQSWTSPSHRVPLVLPAPRALRVNRDLPVLRVLKVSRGLLARLPRLPLVLLPPALPVLRLLSPTPAPTLPRSWTSPSRKENPAHRRPPVHSGPLTMPLL